MLRRRARRALRDCAVDLGLATYRPERRSPQHWSSAYAAGTLSYYEDLDELGRYSVVSGYVTWSATERDEALRVVDVGCGTGALFGRLADQHVKGYLGVDISDTAVAEANRRVARGAEFVVGDATTGEVDLGRPDVIVLNEMLYYVADLGTFLQRIEDALSPQGVVVVSIWRHPGDRALWRRLDRRWTPIDTVKVRNRANSVNDRGWRVTCYRPGSSVS